MFLGSISRLVVAATALAGLSCAGPAPREPVSAAREQSSAAQIQSGQVDDRGGGKREGARKEEKQVARDNKGFVENIEALTEDNRDFRRVLYTAEHSQLVVMALPAGEHIGAEVHDVDQFFRVEEGAGEVVIGQTRTAIVPGTAIVIPAGTRHDIINTGKTPLQLYTIYSPPHHRDGVVHRTRADAEKDEEHFEGTTTE